jgi:tRNA 5-methylaminomethyl-2-thiouridine biosynthesis bifunctional protein
MSADRVKPWLAFDNPRPVTRVAILGAGIAGVSLAYALAQRQVPVVLIEKEQVGSGASGNPAGLLMPYLTADFSLASRLSYAAFGYTRQLILDLAAQASIDFDFSGLDEYPSEIRKAERLEKIAGLSELAGEVTWHGSAQRLHYARAGWVAPRTWLTAMLAQSGEWLSLQEGARFLGADFNQDAVRVKTDCGDWTVSHLVDARGFELGQATPCPLPIQQVRGQLDWLPSARLQSCGLPQLRGKYRIDFSGQSSGALMGASFNQDDLSVEARVSESLANLSPWAQDLVEPWRGDLRSRVAWRGMVSDHLPVVGPAFNEQLYRQQFRVAIQSGDKRCKPLEKLPWITGFYLLGGFGSHGLNLAPFCANWLADRLLNHQNDQIIMAWHQRLHPARFLAKRIASGVSSDD